MRGGFFLNLLMAIPCATKKIRCASVSNPMRKKKKLLRIRLKFPAHPFIITQKIRVKKDRLKKLINNH
jgi:hypothetical protein